MVIGRADEADLVLTDTGVSKLHTRISLVQGVYVVEDLASANGTLVNGEPVRGQRPLQTGDSLALGTALLSFIELPASVGASDERRIAGVKGVEITAPRASALKAASSAPRPSEAMRRGRSGEARPPKDEPKRPKPKDDEVTAPTSEHLLAREEDGESTVPPSPKPQASAVLTAPPPNAQPPPSELRTEIGVPSTPDPASTGLVPASLLKRAPDLSVQETRVLAPADGTLPSGESAPTLSPASLEFPPTRADASVTDEPTQTKPPHGMPAGLKRSSTEELAPGELAADRARRRRVAGKSLGGQLALVFEDLSPAARIVLLVVAGALVLGGGFGLVRWFMPDDTGLPPEPDLLQGSPLHHSFGLGEGVDYPNPDDKIFRFRVNSPTEAAVLLRLTARDLSRDEVSVSVNGVSLGNLPADVGLPDRVLELLIPPQFLHRDQDNVVVFDEVHNPPGNDPWRVGDLWVELLPVLPLSKDDALRQAKAQMKQGAQLFAQKAVGADNVYRAWKSYRLAWQTMLSVPEEERGTLFDQARRRADELGAQLDQECGAVMLEAKKQMELRNPDGAKEILEGVPHAFPGREHRCQSLAEEALTRYEL